jgi:hypothetical protein
MLSVVKSEVRKSLPGLNLVGDQRRCFSVRYPAFTGRELVVDELDLSAAYLTSAVNLKLISPKTKAKMLKLPKRWRLRILGAIARRRSVVEYDAVGVQLSRVVEFDAELRRAWFAIVTNVDDTLRRLAVKLGSDFVFYWYDNLFALRGSMKPALLTRLKFRYRVTKRRLRWIDEGGCLHVCTSDKRVFMLPSAMPGRVEAKPDKAIEAELRPILGDVEDVTGWREADDFLAISLDSSRKGQ